MFKMVSMIEGTNLDVIDIGSIDVNGTFRPLIEGKGWKYTGLDVTSGPNVDIVTVDPFHYPIKDNTYDVVISGSTMEHVTAFWEWVPELVRILKPGGWLCIHTHWQFQEHRYPVDCWRILPDGMEYLFYSTGVLDDFDIAIDNHMDIHGMARKMKPLGERMQEEQDAVEYRDQVGELDIRLD